jgi:hypothetical protein
MNSSQFAKLIEMKKIPFHLLDGDIFGPYGCLHSTFTILPHGSITV